MRIQEVVVIRIERLRTFNLYNLQCLSAITRNLKAQNNFNNNLLLVI